MAEQTIRCLPRTSHRRFWHAPVAGCFTSSLAGVSLARRAAYFYAVDQQFRIKRPLRERMVLLRTTSSWIRLWWRRFRDMPEPIDLFGAGKG